ncbi:MAG: hypothetical protein H5T83_05550 [Actinotalea sp.]|nr:hypothetical protein [Actinotalea sp.]
MTGPTAEPAEAVRRALDALGVAERALGLAARSRTLTPRQRALVDDGDVAGLEPQRVPDPHLRWTSVSGPAVRAETASAVVVVGKFSRSGQVKVRGYVRVDGRLATLKVWRSQGDSTALGRREREVRARIADIPDYRAPQVLAHGVADDGSPHGVDYLLEAVVHGRHPVTPDERRSAVEDLAPALADAYRAYGVRRRHLSAMMPRDLAERLDLALATEPDWPGGERALRRARRRLLGLVQADRFVPCSLGHGDLVATNIVRQDDGRHVLVDWEHGRLMPVAFDLGKLLVTGQADAALRRAAGAAVQGATARGRSADRYTWEEQLLLGLCKRLAAAPERRDRAHAAGRDDAFARQHARELASAAELLDAAARPWLLRR